MKVELNMSMLSEEEEEKRAQYEPNPYFLNETPSQQQTKRLDENREWRVNFLDSHNTNPTKLAKAIYPNWIVFTNKDAYDKYYNPNLYKKSGITEKYTVLNVCRALADYFIDDMSKMGLLLTTPKTKRPYWHPRFTKFTVAVPTYISGTTVQFYCIKCIHSKRFGLVANATFENTNPVKHQVCEKSVSHLKMDIQELFYHSIECSNDVPSDAYQNYVDMGYSRINACFDWVFGCRYDTLVNAIECHPKAKPFFSEDMTAEDKKKWNSENRRIQALDNKSECKWKSFGETINTGNKNYNHDDRSYILLPGYPVKEELGAHNHYMSMARLLYRIVAVFGIEKELSPFLFDEDTLLESWEDSKRRKHEYTFKTNNNQHLNIKEVSVLFGGNEREITPYGPVHQNCHRDGGVKHINIPTGKFPPGSILAPLSQQGRSIYIRSPANTVNIPFGYLLMFRADLPHGGITRRNDNGNQQAALHGHLDSTHLTRQSGYLNITLLEECYMPDEHYMTYSVFEHMSNVIESYTISTNMMKYFWQHRKKEYSTAKKKIGNDKAKKVEMEKFEHITKIFTKAQPNDNSRHNRNRKSSSPTKKRKKV